MGHLLHAHAHAHMHVHVHAHAGGAGRDGWQARLHNLTKSGHSRVFLAALAAHLRCVLIEFAVENVRGRSERVAAPGRKWFV